MSDIQHEPYVFDAFPVNAVHAVAAVVRHQYGETGYRMTLESRYTFETVTDYDLGNPMAQSVWYVFGVRASDGSELHLCADRWERVHVATWTGDTFQLGEAI